MSRILQKTCAALTLASLVMFEAGARARRGPEDPPPVGPGFAPPPGTAKPEPDPVPGQSPSPAKRADREKKETSGREKAVRSEPDKDRHEPGTSPAGTIPGTEPGRDS